jgi:predicted glycogen debranching enzyme
MRPVFTFGTQTCARLPDGAQREWLVSDNCGGYACGTLSGLRTRRYHGLLVVSLGPVARRRMALASLDPVLTLPGGGLVRLGTHEWASGAVDPSGHRLLQSVRIEDGLPVWRWRFGDIVLERELAMAAGTPTVAITHRLLAGPPVELALEPVCTWRDAHGDGPDPVDLRIEPVANGFLVQDAYRVAGPGYHHEPLWLRGAYARQEAHRGLAATEDLLRTGRFTARLRPGESIAVCAWAGDKAALAVPPPPAHEIIAAARHRARSLITAAGATDQPTAALVLAADTFVVRDRAHGRPDVVAGYPWFGAWTRDTMIAYEGLFLCTGRIAEGRELLQGYATTLSGGMLANTADAGSPAYNTADAALWFCHAVQRHVRATGDVDLAVELAGALHEVIEAYLSGTRYGIRVDAADGLLTQDSQGHALTWMDAVIGGVPVTRRAGKAVELNALWINALGGLAAMHQQLDPAAATRGRLADRAGLDLARLVELRRTAIATFRARFPSPRGWLCDVIDGPDGVDESLRPNQLLAVSLPYGPLRPDSASASGVVPDGEAGLAMMHAVASNLLTPLGLRTLDPAAPGYLGVHRGDPARRDRAYHQGTVWPWLIGPYADAAAALGLPVVGLLDGLLAHLPEWGVGSVSETADGDAPHAATGCPSQAWSVAELLRTVQGLRAVGRGEGTG